MGNIIKRNKNKKIIKDCNKLFNKDINKIILSYISSDKYKIRYYIAYDFRLGPYALLSKRRRRRILIK